MIESLSRIESLLQSLKDGDEASANLLVTAFTGMESRSREPLLAALNTDDIKFRDAIVWVLSEIGASISEDLLHLMESGTPIQKNAATEVLGTLALPGATAGLIKALKDDDPEVRNGAAWALVRIGSPAIPQLIPLLSDKSSLIRDTAAWCLAGMGEPAVKPLVESLSKSHELDRKTIISILVEIREAAVKALIGLLSDPERDIRIFAAEALGKIGDPIAVAPLTACLGRDDREVRIKCVEALSSFREAAFPSLAAGLAIENSELRDDIFSVLGLCGRPAESILIDQLENGNADIRRRALRTLGIIKDPGCFERLAESLHDDDPGIRDMAAWALGELEDPRAIAPLVQILGDGNLDAKYTQAAWALAKFKRPDITAIVIPLLHNEVDVVRWKAALALGLFRDDSAVPHLIEALNAEAEDEVRRRIIMTLGDIGDSRTVEPLTEMLINDDGSYWYIIKETLQKIRAGRIRDNDSSVIHEEYPIQ